MDIYLTDAKGTRVAIPILPDRVSVKMGALAQTFQIIKTGEIKIPRGRTATGCSWNSIFPAKSMKNIVESYGREWQKPDKLIKQFDKWLDGNDTLRLLVTETTINMDVFIEQFTYDYFGTSHASYTLSLVARGALTVTTVPAPAKPPTPPTDEGGGGGGSGGDSASYGKVKTHGSRLNIRKKASTSSSIIGKLQNGQKVKLLGKTGNWYIVPCSKGTNGKGYAYASYIKKL